MYTAGFMKAMLMTDEVIPALAATGASVPEALKAVLWMAVSGAKSIDCDKDTFLRDCAEAWDSCEALAKKYGDNK